MAATIDIKADQHAAAQRVKAATADLNKAIAECAALGIEVEIGRIRSNQIGVVGRDIITATPKLLL